MWSEGNYACDCNRRALFTGRFHGKHPCGDGRYRVLELRTFQGELLYEEKPE
jgi:hypothetical protein